MKFKVGDYIRTNKNISLSYLGIEGKVIKRTANTISLVLIDNKYRDFYLNLIR